MQAFFIPTFDALMFFGLSVLEVWHFLVFVSLQNPHNQPEAGVQKVKLCLWPALRVYFKCFLLMQANYLVWPALQIINFRFVPLQVFLFDLYEMQYQVLFTTVGVFFWNIFLSDVANRRGKTTATHKKD